MPPNKEQRERLKEWLKLADNPTDTLTHDVKRGGCQGVRQRGGYANIEVVGNVGQAYERNDITCHLHISLETRGTNFLAQDFCVELQRLPETTYIGVNNPTEATAAPSASPADAHSALAAGPITAVGDSVMIGAAGELNRALDNPAIQADVGLQAADAIAILQRRRAADTLGDIVVVHIGTNGTFTAEQLDEMMRTLADVGRVVFVNVKAPRPWEQPNNNMLANEVRRFSNAVLVDWHAASANRPELFVDDGVHLQLEGQRLYADLIGAHLKAP
jgi:hypothetical protein